MSPENSTRDTYVESYVPGQKLVCFGISAIVKFDATVKTPDSSNESAGIPTINVEMFPSRRDNFGKARRDTTKQSCNVQLDNFELTELAAFLMGAKPRLEVLHADKKVRFERQPEQDGSQKIYLTSNLPHTAIAIPSNRVASLLALVLSRLQKSHSELHPELLLASLRNFQFMRAPTVQPIPPNASDDSAIHRATRTPRPR